MNPFSSYRFFLIATGVLAIAGGALFLIPAPVRSIAPYSTNAQAPEGIAAAVANERLDSLFDLSALPPPAPAETMETAAAPPPDPAAVLKAYRYLGGASADEKSAALFTDGSLVERLPLGEALAGFTLISFDESGAHFRKDNIEAILPLEGQ